MIRGYIREAEPEDIRRLNPPDMRWVVVDALVAGDWQPAKDGMRCRYMMPGRRSCKRPAVVMLNRGRYRLYTREDNWWGYCEDPDHLFGRKWVDGRLEDARLVDKDAQP